MRKQRILNLGEFIFIALNETQLSSFWTPASAGVTQLWNLGTDFKSVPFKSGNLLLLKTRARLITFLTMVGIHCRPGIGHLFHVWNHPDLQRQVPALALLQIFLNTVPRLMLPFPGLQGHYYTAE